MQHLRNAQPNRYSDCHITLEYLGTAISVYSALRPDVRWFKEFLCPQFQVTEEIPDYAVHLIEDDSRFERTLAAGPLLPKQCISSFILDSRVVELPLWATTNGATITVFDNDFAVFYILESRKKQVIVLSASGNSCLRVQGMKIVREIAMTRAILRGHQLMHCAAFSVNGRGGIIAGNKGAGKTSLLLYLLRQSTAAYVSNDRAMISTSGSRFRAYGLPTIATVSPATLEFFAELRGSLAGERFNHERTVSELHSRRAVARAASGNDDAEFSPDVKFTFTPGQLCNLLEASSIAMITLDAIFFSKITKEAGGISLSWLPPSAATAALRDVAYGKTHGRKVSDLIMRFLDADGGLNLESEEAFRERLTSTVPCYQCSVGTDAYRSRSAAQTLQQIFNAVSQS